MYLKYTLTRKLLKSFSFFFYAVFQQLNLLLQDVEKIHHPDGFKMD